MSDKIQKTSRILLITFYILFFLILVQAILQWFWSDQEWMRSYLKHGLGFFSPIFTSSVPVDNGAHFFASKTTPLTYVDIGVHIFTFKEKCIGFIGTIIGLSPLLIALGVLIKVFKNYAIGNIFSLQNAKYYEKLGYLFFYDSLLAKPLYQALLTIAATLSNPPGQREIAFSFTMINLWSIFCGIIVIVIARVMYYGNKLQEEQRLVI